MGFSEILCGECPHKGSSTTQFDSIEGNNYDN